MCGIGIRRGRRGMVRGRSRRSLFGGDVTWDEVMCTIITVLYGQEGTGRQALCTLTIHGNRFNPQDSNFWVAARSFRSSDPVPSHLPSAVLPSACLTSRRQPRPIHHAHPAIRSTNCALTETHSNISPIAPTHFSPTGTVCFYACNVLTDMLSTDVSRHAPAQDTAAHCIPTTVAHELRLWLRVVRMHHG